MMTDIVTRLRSYTPEEIAAVCGFKAFQAMMCEAADEIERLRSIAGKANVGESFADLTSELRHQTPDA